jgi:hypothetical protein
MIKRLPRFAEVTVQRLCAESGALCHPVGEDESGWDLLIEFPPKSHPGPADTRPPASTAYVQVKSVRNGRPLTCRIKLSNALRAVQSPQPWFIVLVNQDARVYAIHVWEELVRRTLEAVRRAENKQRPLNRSEQRIRFEASDEKGNELVLWMQESIDSVKQEYDEAKRAIYQAAGYEAGYGTVRMTIEARTAEEIMKNFLGVGDGLRVSRFTFTSTRFGIPAPVSQIEASSGIVHIAPVPAGDIELRLRSHLTSQPIVLSGKVYHANLPGESKNQNRLRFSASFLEIVWGPGADTECHIKLAYYEKHDLATIGNFVTLNEWLTGGAVNLQVWSQGRRITVGILNKKDLEPAQEWPKVAVGVRLLQSAAASAIHPIKVSLYDLELAPGLKTFSEISKAGSFRVVFDKAPDAPAHFTAILYWFHVDVGEHVFYFLVEWTVVEDILIDAKRRLTAEKHRLLDSYVLTNAGAAARKMMHSDYERHLAQMQQTAALGDLREFIATST